MDGNIDLIILPSYVPSFWNRLFAPVLPRVVERVIREAPCGVFLTTASNRFNCEKTWGRPGNDNDAAPDQLDGHLESKTSPALLTEDAPAWTRERHRVAA